MYTPVRPEVQEACIDPRLLYALGEGVGDFEYDVEAIEQEGTSIDLQEPETFSSPKGGRELGFGYTEESPDVSAAATPHTETRLYRPNGSLLKAQAEEYVPVNLRPALALATTPRVRRVSSRVRATTPRSPRITVSPAQESPLDGRVGHRRRRSSLRPRMLSSSHARSNYDEHFPPLNNPDIVVPISAGNGVAIVPSTVVTPRQWVMDSAYNIGDRVPHPQPSTSPGVTFSTGPPCPDLTLSAPTILSSSSQSSRGHRCAHPGCKIALKGRVFATPSELKKHSKSHMSNEQRPYACNMCPSRWYDMRDLNRHMDKVHKGLSETCLVCGDTIGRQDNLGRHQRTLQCRLHLPQPPTTRNELFGPSLTQQMASEMRRLSPGVPIFVPLSDVAPVQPRPNPLWSEVVKRGTCQVTGLEIVK